MRWLVSVTIYKKYELSNMSDRKQKDSRDAFTARSIVLQNNIQYVCQYCTGSIYVSVLYVYRMSVCVQTRLFVCCIHV